MKKTPGDITVLEKCTKNHDHEICHAMDVILIFHFEQLFAL